MTRNKIKFLRMVHRTKFTGILNSKMHQGSEIRLVREPYYYGYRVSVIRYNSYGEKVAHLTDYKCELELKLASKSGNYPINNLYHKGDLSEWTKQELSIYRALFDRI